MPSTVDTLAIPSQRLRLLEVWWMNNRGTGAPFPERTPLRGVRSLPGRPLDFPSGGLVLGLWPLDPGSRLSIEIEHPHHPQADRQASSRGRDKGKPVERR
jgi:hypothetical protein